MPAEEPEDSQIPIDIALDAFNVFPESRIVLWCILIPLCAVEVLKAIPIGLSVGMVV